MNAADILERAADKMQRCGKCEGVGGYRGRVCAIGALAYATDDLAPELSRSLVSDWPAYIALKSLVGHVPDWSDKNDAPTVIAGLRAVAATLRAQEQTEPAPAAELVPA